ncbi:peptidoglycan DD-metalloendopeptidase family protein [Salsuginibacillus kocurii]|uniref:peptidoglycan DD-metalloendopeptidase family protein n=1 Tax=Salsuginibacillus kocurii TaxID=427078 RepID=UPI000370D146|nr:peptidoglycan DD-metalloendopeptidase family protein [Salsuginibacillus kocurii]
MKKQFFLFIITGVAFMLIGSFSETDTAQAHNHAKVWPVAEEGEITDTFGTRGGTHFGIDIAAPAGTPVIAVAEGIVSRSYYSSTYGEVIFIEHPSGKETVYAHLQARYLSENDPVNQGDFIGELGMTGTASGPHLHFEIHEGPWTEDKRYAVDPLVHIGTSPTPTHAGAAPHVDGPQHAQVLSESEVSSSSGEKIHTVEEGDSLWEISEKNDISLTELKDKNDVKDHYIYPGDEIVVPAS